MDTLDNLTPIRQSSRRNHNSTSLMFNSPSAELIKQRQKRYSTPLKEGMNILVSMTLLGKSANKRSKNGLVKNGLQFRVNYFGT